jgi:transposase
LDIGDAPNTCDEQFRVRFDSAAVDCNLLDAEVFKSGLIAVRLFVQRLSDVSAYGSKYGYLLRECLLLIVATEEWTMRKTTNSPGEKIVKDIKRATRKHYSSEEKIRIVLDGLRGEDSIAELCRREGISQGIYYKWSKDFMEAGKKRLAGDTARAANTDEVKELRREAKDLKEVVAEQTLELRLLKKSMIGDGGDHE